MPRLLVPGLLVLALVVPAGAHATSIPVPGAPSNPAAPGPAAVPMPPMPPASSGSSTGRRFMTVAVGAAVGALMPQLVVVDGIVLMSAVMGGMIADMAYTGGYGMPQK